MNPALSDEEKAHKILEGMAPCVKCGEFWEEPGMLRVHSAPDQVWCIFCYINELKADLEDIKCKSPKSALAVPSSGTAMALSPMSSLTLLESMYGYRTRERLRRERNVLPLGRPATI